MQMVTSLPFFEIARPSSACPIGTWE